MRAAYQPADPLDQATKMGSMVDETQTKRVMGYIAKGKEEGAALALGGKQVRQESGGFYIEPTIFDRVDNRMTIAREEIFGPVLATITFKTMDEAVKLANESSYGLEANVFTSDLSQGAQDGAGAEGRRRHHQHARHRRDRSAVRRLQAVGLRARPLAARAGEIHAAQVDLYQRPADARRREDAVEEGERAASSRA